VCVSVCLCVCVSVYALVCKCVYLCVYVQSKKKVVMEGLEEQMEMEGNAKTKYF